MATTAIWDVTDRLDRVIDYATNPNKTENHDFSSSDFQGLRDVLEYTQQEDKTEKQFYVSGINCDPATAHKQMSQTKLQFQKTDGILAFHGYQSFAPGEATPETAHAIGVNLAKELWGDRFEVVVSTHLNKQHLHNHFVLNSVSFMDGKRYYDNNATYALMRQASDRLCREYSLSVIENPQKGKSKHYAEWKSEQEGKPTWRGLIREDVDKAIATSMTFACDCNAIILAHNHPGGSKLFSPEDNALTQRIVNIFHPLEIKVLDHIIVGGASYSSMAERGNIPHQCKSTANYEVIALGASVTAIEYEPDEKDEESIIKYKSISGGRYWFMKSV